MCELVGQLNEFEEENMFEQNKFGIYRDDGLAIVESKSGPVIERLPKNSERI